MTKISTNYLPVLTAAYAVCLILANITSVKLVSIFDSLTIDGGFIFFPITYIINDIVTEVYGFRVSKRMIWTGFSTAIFAAIGVQIINAMPPSSDWYNQSAFEQTLGLSTRIFAASLISYLFGEFLNSMLLAAMKVQTEGRYQSARFIISSIFGALIENFLFYVLAFYGQVTFDVLLQMMALQYILKICYELLFLPLSCYLANKLKELEGIDYYDKKTKFNIL